MKIILVIALLAAFATADYTPDWKSCSSSSDPWIPTSVVIDKKPVPNVTANIHVCGNIQDTVIIASFKLQVKLAGIVVLNQVVPLNKQEVFPGSVYCFDHSAFIPIIAKGNFDITFVLQEEDTNGIGCVNLNFTI